MPRGQIYPLPAGKTLADVKEDTINSRFSRIALYAKDPLDNVGTVRHPIFLREIAKDDYQVHVRDFMADPIFVNWFTKDDALPEKY